MPPSTNSDQPGIPIYEDRIPHATGHSIPLLFPADKSPSASYSKSYQKVPELSYSRSAIFPANTSETNSRYSDHGNSYSHSIESCFPADRSTSEISEESSPFFRFAESEEPSSTYEYNFSTTTVGLSGGVHQGTELIEGVLVLHDTVKEVGNKAIRFKPILKRLKSTLGRLEPTVSEIIRLNAQFDRPEAETRSLIEEMKKGANLVRKCLKIPWWNYLSKVYYNDKLCELNDTINRFCQVDLSTRNGLHMLQTVINIQETMGSFRHVEAPGVSCAVSKPLDFTVGLDMPLKELKTLLLKEEVQLLLLTAPEGCGKTTLVEMLCQDKQIQGTSVSFSFVYVGDWDFCL